MAENEFQDINFYHCLPIMVVKHDGKIIKINSVLEQLLGIKPAEINNKNVFSLFPPLNIPFFDGKNIDIKNILSPIYVRYNQNNKFKTFRLDTNIIKNESYALIIFHQEENWGLRSNEIENSLLKLSSALEGTDLGVWEYNLKTLQATFSLKFKELIGVDINEDITWNSFKAKIFKEDQGIFTSYFKHHLTSFIPLNIEFRLQKNNKTHWFSLKGESFSEGQKPISTLGTLMDCTEEKNILNSLNNAIESKNIAMSVGKIGTWRAELNSENEWDWDWDNVTNTMFDLKPTEKGSFTKWIDKLHPQDRERVWYALEHSLKTGELFSQRFRAKLSSNDIRYYIGNGLVGKDSLGHISRIDGTFVDETILQNSQQELKKMNLELEKRVEIRTEELVKSKEKAEKASQIKTDFLAMMSHELRTPMNAVIGSLDLLQSTKQETESRELIDTAKKSAENLVFILNDILDINKIEAGKMTIEDLTFSLPEIVDNVVQIFIPVAQKKNITFEVFEDPLAPSYVKGDSIRVRQILFNLIGNALKFTPSTAKKPGVVILQVEQLENNDYVSNISIKVTDNGIGIAKDVQATLFKPFIQAELSTTRNYGGTGLGLAICHKLSEMMGGKIQLDSQPDEGSTFEVDIPFWKSLETQAMEIMELSGANIALITTADYIAIKIKQIETHLINAGAAVIILQRDDPTISSQNFDATFIFIDTFDNKEEEIKTLIKSINNKKIALTVKFTLLKQVKEKIPNITTIDFDTLTKIQLIEIVRKIRDNSHVFDLDELNIIEELADDGFELDLDLDLEALSPSSSKNIKEETLKKGILLVEDNSLNQELIAKQLKNLGYECDVADDGEQGKNKWLSGNYKLILTDCHMPKLDGYEMTKLIRKIEREKKNPQIPIIAVTGAAMTGDAEQCYQAGMDDFVSKPIQQSDLKNILKNWYKHD